jgi:hypothetical protein
MEEGEGEDACAGMGACVECHFYTVLFSCVLLS